MPKAASSKSPTKAHSLSILAEKTGLPKAQVELVMSQLEALIADSLRKHKEFNLFGILKVVVAHKAATKARPGRNPATGEMMTFKAKAAHDVVRVRALKRLKEMI